MIGVIIKQNLNLYFSKQTLKNHEIMNISKQYESHNYLNEYKVKTKEIEPWIDKLFFVSKR